MTTNQLLLPFESNQNDRFDYPVTPASSFFFLFFFTTVLFQWDFFHGKFRLLSPGKASCNRVALPNLLCMLGVWCFHHPPDSGMDYGIFNVRTFMHAIAHGVYGHTRESLH